MLVWTICENFRKDMALGLHDWDSHTYKVAFLSSHVDEADDELGDTTQITAGSGYSSGGLTVTISSVVQNADGTTSIFTNDPSITTSGILPTTWAFVLYNDTSTGDRLIAYCNLSVGIVLPSGITWPLGFDTDNGLLRIG